MAAFPRLPSRLGRLVVLALLIPGCRDATGLEEVASIEIGGVPTQALEVGMTVELTATPKNAAGEALSSHPVTWLSSDTALARVSASGTVTARATGQVVVVATSGAQSATATLTIAQARVARIVISGVPEEPVATGTAVTLTATLYSQWDNVITGRPVYWSTSDYGRATVGSDGTVQTRAEGDVDIVASSDGVSETVVVRIVDTVESVSISPSDGRMYETQVRAFTATALNALGNPVSGRDVAWTSAAEGTATVDGEGNVTGVAAGTTEITATIEGVSATVPVGILARPVADWTAATDWTTHQGNARHTGHVPVTVDPVVFQESWARAPFSGVALNAVTAAAGKVFVSSNAYFGTQRLAVLDATTGEETWSYDFGDIHSVHPPAFGLDRVFVTTGGHEDSHLWAFDVATGDVRFRSSYGNQWSRYYAPVVAGDTVFMAGGYYGGMYAFSADDGTQHWFVGTNQYDEWTPAVADGLVYAYTGEYTPQVAIVEADSGTVAATIADPNFSWDGWTMHVSPALGSMDNLLATQGGRLISFDLADGTVAWERTGSFAGNVTVADGVLYVFNNQQVEARSEADGALLWVWIPPQGQQPGWTMIATDNLLFVSTGSHTYALDLDVRKDTWSHPAGGQLALSGDGVLLIAGQNGTLTAIDVR